MSLTPYEKRELKWWNFLAAYDRYKTDFEYLAEVLYVNNCPEWADQQDDVKLALYEELLGVAVEEYGRWQDIQKEGRKSQMHPLVYASFAPVFGKHIAEQNQHLLKDPCPQEALHG